MEFCSGTLSACALALTIVTGGGIIDLLNKRLRDRLQEIEILNIFTDICEVGVARSTLRSALTVNRLSRLCTRCHGRSYIVISRQVTFEESRLTVRQIENVLSAPSGSAPSPNRPTPLTFKLCDFGSTTFPATSPPSTKLESDVLAMDLQKNTTLQYRSPEMVEPMLGWAVGLPSGESGTDSGLRS